MEGNNIIQGASTIYFDKISKERVYESIDSAKLNQVQFLKKGYQDLKFKLGRIPRLRDFDDLGELDPLSIIGKFGSYQNFLKKYDNDFADNFSMEQYGILEFVSSHFASGMRIHELSLLKILIDEPDMADLWSTELKESYGIMLDPYSIASVRNVLTNKFFRGATISPDLIDADSKCFKPSASLIAAISDETFKEMLKEIIDFGIYRYERDFSKNYPGTLFSLYKKYTYKDVCWLLNWKREEVSLNIGGYKFDKYTKTYPVFINYEKSAEVGATTRYEDRFVDQSNIYAISKSKRTIKSEDVEKAIHGKEQGILMPLFVRKNKDDQTSKEFYFLGTMAHNGDIREFIMPDTDNISAVEIGYRLDTPVESNLFEYITEKSI